MMLLMWIMNWTAQISISYYEISHAASTKAMSIFEYSVQKYSLCLDKIEWILNNWQIEWKTFGWLG